MTDKFVLIAGIGNIFHGDDAFGIEVARRMSAHRLPNGVLVRDFGIRGFDLAFALVDGWDTVILVDAVARGAAPGSIFLIEPERNDFERVLPRKEIDPHGMDPVQALRLAQSIGELPRRLLLVACEPAELGGEEGVMGLSPAVSAAIGPAVAEVERCLTEALPLARAARRKNPVRSGDSGRVRSQRSSL